jgi:aminoglycoside 6'-N-acetyltransferase I
MNKKFNIRKMEPSERDQWKRMRKALWPKCPESRHESEMNWILSSKGIVIGAESIPQGLIGFAEISIRTDHVDGTTTSPVPYLEGWYVDPSFRGQGIGRALIRSVEEFVLLAGFIELASDTEVNDKAAIDIHKHFGFNEVGKTVHFVKSLIDHKS